MIWRYVISASLLGLVTLASQEVSGGETKSLIPAETPADNPLKGLVPYAGGDNAQFPHSLEFDYVRLSEVMTGSNKFDWQPIESRLNSIASRRCQAVFRVWIEYPRKTSGLPQFLIDGGVKIIQWEDFQESPSIKHFTPDYEDERLVRAIESFISEFGNRYDGDPRLGYLTAGFLGEWGEWHNWPREDLFASKRTQLRVIQAYENAFKQTPVLLRYPAGDDHETYVSNSQRPFGYHDDSFAWATLDTGKSKDSWFYMSLLKAAGQEALDKWKSQPIGGEIRPELWGQIFDAKPKHKQAQDFAECVQKTHVTWLMDSGMFERKQATARIQRATEQIRMMGYDLQIATSLIEVQSNGNLEVTLTVINRGVAPFYSDWPLELAALSFDGTVLKTFSVDWQLPGILPGSSPQRWNTQLVKNGVPADARKLALRAVHPLANGKQLHFANAEQNADAQGWLTLGTIPE